MVKLGFGGSESVTCEGCGAEIPAFLDGCPYCDGEAEIEGTLPCPSCGAEIHEDSQRCPVCEAWVTMRLPKKGGRGAPPLVVLGLVVLLVLGFILALLS